MTATLTASPPARQAARLSAEAIALRAKFPDRTVPAGWEATCQDRH